MDFGFWILDFGFWILDFGFWILDFGFWILDLGFWILDFGFWSLDFGFWILDQFSIRSFCGGPKRRRLDFGVWILEFGFWILVWMRPYSTSFGSCIRYFHVTPTRVGGFYISGGAGFQPSTIVNGLFHPYISRLDTSRKYVK